MKEDIAAKTKKTYELKSSDGKQLGTVSDIVNNRVLMTVFVGRRGQFVIPEKMIDNVRKGTVYFALTKKEFEKWWATEGQELEREYEKDPDVALGKKIVGKALLLLREDIGTAFEANFGPKIPKDKRQKLCSEQEDLRIPLPAQIRDGLDSDEWIYRSLKMSEREEDFFVVTSGKMIRLKPGWGKWFNWMIPIDKIESISTFHEERYWKEGENGLVGTKGQRFGRIIPGPGVLGIIRRGTIGGDMGIIRINYRLEKDLRFEELYLPSKAYWDGQLTSIKEFLEEVLRGRGRKTGPLVAVFELICPSCGHENPSNAEFCIECGRELK